MIVMLLALIDIYALIIVIFNRYLPWIYILGGSLLLIIKGIFFFSSSKDILSFLDIIVALIIVFTLFLSLWTFLYWAVVIYLAYKISMSFMVFK